MKGVDHWRGNPIYQDGDDWRYMDTGDYVAAADRACGVCGQERTLEGHDPCLGNLPGVVNACCGHGHDMEAYIQFDDGSEVRGLDAVRRMRG